MAKAQINFGELGGGGGLNAHVETLTNISTAQTINCGFEPKHIAVIGDAGGSTSSSKLVAVWDTSNGDLYIGTGSGGTTYWMDKTSTATSGRNCINNITSTGFTFTPAASASFFVFVIG